MFLYGALKLVTLMLCSSSIISLFLKFVNYFFFLWFSIFTTTKTAGSVWNPQPQDLHSLYLPLKPLVDSLFRFILFRCGYLYFFFLFLYFVSFLLFIYHVVSLIHLSANDLRISFGTLKLIRCKDSYFPFLVYTIVFVSRPSGSFPSCQLAYQMRPVNSISIFQILLRCHITPNAFRSFPASQFHWIHVSNWIIFNRTIIGWHIYVLDFV